MTGDEGVCRVSMRVEIISFTDRGQRLAVRLAGLLERNQFNVSVCSGREGSVREWAREAFANAGALIYIGAIGICVRTIAPLIRSKTTDPAVVVVDETAKYAIPVLGGHLGGANDLARRIARLIGAEAVITTATDRNGVFSPDAWARVQGCAVENPWRIRSVSAKLLEGRNIVIESDYPIDGEPPEQVSVTVRGIHEEGRRERLAELPDAALSIYRRAICEEIRTGAEEKDLPMHRRENCEEIRIGVEEKDLSMHRREIWAEEILRIVPRIVCAGVGCRKGASASSIEDALKAAFEEAGISESALFRICSIDLKKDEEGLREACRRRKIDFLTFSADQLAEAPGEFRSSAFVKEITGVDNVCERAAVLGAADESGSPGRLIFSKHVYEGVTAALAVREFRPDFRWMRE